MQHDDKQVTLPRSSAFGARTVERSVYLARLEALVCCDSEGAGGEGKSRTTSRVRLLTIPQVQK